MGNFETYERDGKNYERVTHIINYFQPPELAEWRAKVGNKEANRVMKVAANFGTAIDEAIRLDWVNPKVKKESAESKYAFQAFKYWKNDYAVKELLFPETLFDDELLVAGTPDFVLDLTIVDLKCSSSVKPTYFAQLGGYALMCGFKPEDLAVLRLDKGTGMYEFVRASDVGLSVADCINYFKSLLYSYRTYKQVQRTLKPKESSNECTDE